MSRNNDVAYLPIGLSASNTWFSVTIENGSVHFICILPFSEWLYSIVPG